LQASKAHHLKAFYHQGKDKSNDECAPKSKNFVKFEANGFFDPQLSFDNEDLKNGSTKKLAKLDFSEWAQ